MGTTRGHACSCFGPSTFCETLNPPYAPPIDPAWWIPDHIVMGVKLITVEYGVDLKVVQDFSGDLETDQVIRVWGDCGLLCRMYNTDVTDGDTVLWAIQHCDLSGNFGCGMSVEEEGHYQLSVCGVYWLDYANGVVSGPLFTEGANETVSLAEFGELVNGCLPTRVEDPMAPEVTVRCIDGELSIVATGDWSGTKDVCITDVAGRVVHEARFRGAQGTMLLPRKMDGVLMVRVSDGRHTIARKLFFD
ncbi:MAG: hypothetical protein IPL52_14580 [Flavobacteriales bacterium]|nr:hypothetical protein [Flavobacteriales bacterium]